MNTTELESYLDDYQQQGVIARGDVVFTMRYYRKNLGQDFTTRQLEVIHSFLVKKLFHVGV
jgi:hypothetical protein